MFTGISGSNTVRIASTISGFSSSVFAGSGTSTAVVSFEEAGVAGTSGIICNGFMSFGRGRGFAIEGGLQSVPRQAGALHAYGKLPHARQHRQLAEIFDRRSGAVVTIR